MKIALTADNHLSSRSRHPERYQALENILHKLPLHGCSTLLIAGDLFDKDLHNHAEFDLFCAANAGIDFHIIPGNHDNALIRAGFASPNVHVYHLPTKADLGEPPVKFLFLPYRHGMSMGEVLAEIDLENLPPRRWNLVAHGDWVAGRSAPNPLELGVYMPLTRFDLERFSPALVFLGHIHAPLDGTNVHYIGSPCPLDSSETGLRRFLIYDTLNGEVIGMPVEPSLIYQQETITIMPVDDEAGYLHLKAQECMRGWGLAESDLRKVRLRLKAVGWSRDKNALPDLLMETFSAVTFDRPPDLDAVSLAASDPLRIELAQQVAVQLAAEPLLLEENSPQNDRILQSALEIIYGV